MPTSPSRVAGERSLASCLGGGDLDGDLYDIYVENPSLLPTLEMESAKYISVGTHSIGRASTVDDICDFVVEYIHSDVLPLLADKHLVISDQSIEGSEDPRCMQLAQLCSQAVDYPKNGIPVDLDNGKIPKLRMAFKPDWKKAEVSDVRDADYYESDRALGHLYRNIHLQKLEMLDIPIVQSNSKSPFSDPISFALLPIVRRTLNMDYINPDGTSTMAATLFAQYVRELQYIRVTHTLSDAPDIRLSEEEVVVGAILANCTENRWRQDRTYRMRIHSEMLIKDIRRRMRPEGMDPDDTAEAKWKTTLQNAWDVWDWSLRHSWEEGTNSFGLVALGLVLDCLKKLEALPA